tara:strand:- start:42 stop:209 length:168 start_codon:yes stop_codon:yes gene_type:complete
MDWFNKKRVLPRWRLIGILFIAIAFGYTLAISVVDGSYSKPMIIALCGILFAYEK